MPATIKNHLSPADSICARRLIATNVADMNPATPAITHLKISIGTTDKHCTKTKILNSKDENAPSHSHYEGENLKSANSPEQE